MNTNNIDKIIKDKLENRTITPSVSAWERLHHNLEQQEPPKRKKWLPYFGYVASIIVLISVFILVNNKEENIVTGKEIIVVKPIDTLPLKSNNIKNNILKEEAVASIKQQKNNIPQKEFISVKKAFKRPVLKDKPNLSGVNQVAIQQEKRIGKEVVQPDVPQEKIKRKNRISIEPEDLLYAVTHNEKEVKAYYAKYNVNRNAVLDTIEKQLVKSNLKIDANTILAEVERDIDEDDFRNNFMQRLKSKISDIAVAISDRNK